MKERRATERRLRARFTETPEQRAARVEEVYAAIPLDKRRDAELNYEHVRLVLSALDTLP